MTDVDRAYIFLFHDDRILGSNTHEWCPSGIEPQIQRLKNIPINTFPWFAKSLLENKVVNCPDADELPSEASVEKEELVIEKIKSIVLVPISTKGIVKGFIGLDSVRSKRTWAEKISSNF